MCGEARLERRRADRVYPGEADALVQLARVLATEAQHELAKVVLVARVGLVGERHEVRRRVGGREA